jgi:hypothetical protein
MEVRAAGPGDLPPLAGIEQSGDKLFATYGIVFPPGPMVIEALVAHGAAISVIGDPPVGFAGVISLDGHPHLEQISVQGDRTGAGIGSRLLEHVAVPGMTLITFRDIPWNGPWYAGHGFAEYPEAAWGAQLAERWRAEVAAGLHVLGARLVMRYG